MSQPAACRVNVILSFVSDALTSFLFTPLSQNTLRIDEMQNCSMLSSWHSPYLVQHRGNIVNRLVHSVCKLHGAWNWRLVSNGSF